MDLPDSDRRVLLKFARETLSACFSGQYEAVLKRFQTQSIPESLSGPYPCFVTLQSKSGRLRGCIGQMSTNSPLFENVHLMTRQAAFHDPRFRPVTREEVDALVIEITVLGPLKPLPSLDQLEVGKHGLWIGKGNRTGVLLAHVATEQGWNREEFLAHTCEKAGLDPAHVQEYEVQYFDELCFSEGNYASPK